MLSTTPYKKKISVRLYPRLAATNQGGFCPVRLTARWHGQELQVDTGEINLPQRVRSDGEIEKLWQSNAQMVLGHADEDVTDRYAKDKARLLAPAVLDAWQKILGKWYDGVPVR